MYLEEIVENLELESDKYEAKAVLNREDVVGWLKSIAGFANASGGEFYIGVDSENPCHCACSGRTGNRSLWSRCRRHPR